MKSKICLSILFVTISFYAFTQNIIAPFSLSDQFHFYNGSAPETNWTRGVIANNLNWNNTTKRWERPTTHLDFSMIRFSNGKLSFVQGIDWSGNLTSFTTQEIEEDWTRLTIAHNGNVGVGVNVPDAKLHVGGEIWSNEGLKLFKNNNTIDARFGYEGNGGYMFM